MQPSFFKMVRPGTATSPAIVVTASSVPLRVVVRNDPLSGAQVVLALDRNDFATGGAATFAIPTSNSEVFLLAPRQTLYASAPAPNVQIYVAASEAFPATA